MTTSQPPRVAVLDTSPDFIAILTDLLEMEGYTTVADDVTAFRTGRKDIRAFLDQHDPDVIIYDIAIPYEQNWAFFQQVLAVSGRKPCQFVLATTNRTALDQLVGETGSLEIIGKPFDLDRLLAAVSTSIAECRK